MRIAQLVIAPVALAEPEEMADLPGSERAERGFGSSAH
jgi:dUTPase